MGMGNLIHYNVVVFKNGILRKKVIPRIYFGEDYFHSGSYGNNNPFSDVVDLFWNYYFNLVVKVLAK